MYHSVGSFDESVYEDFACEEVDGAKSDWVFSMTGTNHFTVYGDGDTFAGAVGF